ncbi:Uncharacterised protein g5734 [Pycnogonum litorale]
MNTHRRIFVMLLVTRLVFADLDLGAAHSRRRRAIFITNGTRLSFSPRVTIPIPSYFDQVSASFRIRGPAVSIRYLTGFTAGRTSEDRLNLFSYIEGVMDRSGIDGRSCLLRSICEIGDMPNHSLGMIGDVIDILLTASDDEQESNGLAKYREAEKLGRYYGHCDERFRSCPISFFL